MSFTQTVGVEELPSLDMRTAETWDPIIVGSYGTNPMHWILSPKETRLGSGTANFGLNQLIFIESSNNKVKID